MPGHSRRSPSQPIKSRQLHASKTVTTPGPPTSSSNGLIFRTKSSKNPITQGHRTIMTHNSLATLLPKTRVVPIQQQKQNKLFLAPSPLSFRSFSTTAATTTSDNESDAFHTRTLKYNAEELLEPIGQGALAQRRTDHSKLKTFWSTPTPERDGKFKQIILQREIGLEDFQAILSNSFHLQRHDKGVDRGASAFSSFNNVSFPWHLTLTSHHRYMGSEYNGTVRNFQAHVSSDNGTAQKETLYIDDVEWWTLVKYHHSGTSYFESKFGGSDPFTALGRKLLANNSSPIPKLDITSITADNIDLIDGLFEKVNIYDLVPKGKILSYFFSNPDLDWMFDSFDSDLMGYERTAAFQAGFAAYVGNLLSLEYCEDSDEDENLVNLARKLGFEADSDDDEIEENIAEIEENIDTFLNYFDPKLNQFRWDVWDENSPDYTPTEPKGPAEIW